MWNRKVKAKTVEKYIQFSNLCFDGILKQVLFCMRISGASCFLLSVRYLYSVGFFFGCELSTAQCDIYGCFGTFMSLKTFFPKEKPVPETEQKMRVALNAGRKWEQRSKQGRTGKSDLMRLKTAFLDQINHEFELCESMPHTKICYIFGCCCCYFDV